MQPHTRGERRVTRRGLKRAGSVVMFAGMVLLPLACGSEGSSSPGDTSSTPVITATIPETTTTTTTMAVSTATAPLVSVPTTCAEVDAWLTRLSPSDRALLGKAPLLLVRRIATGTDSWQILSMIDVTGQFDPELTVTYDWSPETGMSDPVMVVWGDNTFIDDPNAETVLMMRCMNTVN